jgi:hypothetical protein
MEVWGKRSCAAHFKGIKDSPGPSESVHRTHESLPTDISDVLPNGRRSSADPTIRSGLRSRRGGGAAMYNGTLSMQHFSKSGGIGWILRRLVA